MYCGSTSGYSYLGLNTRFGLEGAFFVASMGRSRRSLLWGEVLFSRATSLTTDLHNATMLECTACCKTLAFLVSISRPGYEIPPVCPDSDCYAKFRWRADFDSSSSMPSNASLFLLNCISRSFLSYSCRCRFNEISNSACFINCCCLSFSCCSLCSSTFRSISF